MYAIAKIAGLKMCKAYNVQFKTDFRAVMPTNLYGQNDNYDSLNSHVLAALIKKIVLAKKQNKKSFIVWGTGKPKREFLHVDDLADATLKIMNLSKSKYNKISIIIDKNIKFKNTYYKDNNKEHDFTYYNFAWGSKGAERDISALKHADIVVFPAVQEFIYFADAMNPRYV